MKATRVSTKTLSRWAQAGKVPEPYCDRRGWRVFTEIDLRAIVRYATQLVPPPSHARARETAPSYTGITRGRRSSMNRVHS